MKVYNFWVPSHNREKQLLASSFLSVHPSARNNSAATRLMFMIFGISLFFENLSRKFKFH